MPYLPELPKKTPRDASRLYVVRFNGGHFKVGRSCDVKARIRALTWDPFRTGIHITDGWYSDGHVNCETNEMRLILFCRERFGAPNPRTAETFTGDYEATVAYAQSLITAADAAGPERTDAHDRHQPIPRLMPDTGAEDVTVEKFARHIVKKTAR